MDIVLDGFPGPLRPAEGGSWRHDAGGLIGTAGPTTDLFVDPAGAPPVLSAPRLLAAVPDGDFQLWARVEVEFAAMYDAGVLLLWAGDDIWAKLCFEFSPQRQPMIVSVVTRGVSDDANGFTVDGSAAWLRVSLRDGAYAFHASTDGAFWHLIRHFSLGGVQPDVGFEVQSPVGQGCTARFTEITYRTGKLAELRDGT